MKCLETTWMQDMIRICGDGFRQGWHERNGGNLSYRISQEAIAELGDQLHYDQPWQSIGTYRRRQTDQRAADPFDES